MSKEIKIYFNDIIESAEKIEKYVNGISFEEFKKNTLICDAVIRNLEIIGEAVKNIPKDIKDQSNDIEWKKIAGLRDILIHEYSGVNLEIIWDVIKNKLLELKLAILELSIGKP